jgi:hypothetical protein
LSRKCGSLDVSLPYGFLQLVTEIAFSEEQANQAVSRAGSSSEIPLKVYCVPGLTPEKIVPFIIIGV